MTDIRVDLNQVFKAVQYANDHPDCYLSGTTNWCAAVAFALNRQIIDAQPDASEPKPVEPRVSIEQCVALKEAAEILKGVSDRRIARDYRRLGIEPKPVDLGEAAFEAWHNSFYGPQDEYNPIRSLEKHPELGYIDGVVTAQLAAFNGGRAHPAPAGVVKLPKRLPPEHWMAYGWNACIDEVARLNK